jgi:glycosyltransferase involved in cell wall biosynthesis
LEYLYSELRRERISYTFSFKILKIILFTSSYLPVLGGLQEAVYQLTMELKRQGHDVSVLTNRYPRHLKRHEIIDGVNVERMLFTGFYLPSFNPYVVLKYIAGLLIGFVNFCRLMLLLSKQKPDVMNIHFLGSQAPYAMLASKFLKTRCIVSLHGDDVEGLPHRSSIDRWLFKRVLQAADYVTACSQYLLNEAKKIVQEIGPKSTTIWNGINPEEYRNVQPYIHPRPYILAAGRFVYKKGFDLLLRAYRFLLDKAEKVDLILAGDGLEKDNLLKLAKELGLSIVIKEAGDSITPDTKTNMVLFWGRAGRNEMKSLMKGCELFVIPSRKEPFGIVALEAFAAGKRVVAGKTGGLTEIIHEGESGYFAEAGNDEDLARGIKKGLSDNSKNLRIDLSDNTWKRVTKKYLDVFGKASN